MKSVKQIDVGADDAKNSYAPHVSGVDGVITINNVTSPNYDQALLVTAYTVTNDGTLTHTHPDTAVVTELSVAGEFKRAADARLQYKEDGDNPVTDDIIDFKDIVEYKAAADANPEVPFACHFEIKKTPARLAHDAVQKAAADKAAAIKVYTDFAQGDNSIVKLAKVEGKVGAEANQNHPKYTLFLQDDCNVVFKFKEGEPLADKTINTGYKKVGDNIVDSKNNVVLTKDQFMAYPKYDGDAHSGKLAVVTELFKIEYDVKAKAPKVYLGQPEREYTKIPPISKAAIDLQKKWVAEIPDFTNKNEQLDADINVIRNRLLYAHIDINSVTDADNFRTTRNKVLDKDLPKIEADLESIIKSADNGVETETGKSYPYTQQADYLKLLVRPALNNFKNGVPNANDKTKEIPRFERVAEAIAAAGIVTRGYPITTDSIKEGSDMMNLKVHQLKAVKRQSQEALNKLAAIVNSDSFKAKFPTLYTTVEAEYEKFEANHQKISDFVSGRVNGSDTHTFDIGELKNIPSRAKQAKDVADIKKAAETVDSESKKWGIPYGVVLHGAKSFWGSYGKEIEVSSTAPFGDSNMSVTFDMQIGFVADLIAALKTIPKPVSEISQKNWMGSGSKVKVEMNNDRVLYNNHVSSLLTELEAAQEKATESLKTSPFDFMGKIDSIISRHLGLAAVATSYSSESKAVADLAQEFGGSKSFMLRVAETIHTTMTGSDAYKDLDEAHQAKALGKPGGNDEDKYENDILCAPYGARNADDTADHYKGNHPKSEFVAHVRKAFNQFSSTLFAAYRLNDLPEVKALQNTLTT